MKGSMFTTNELQEKIERNSEGKNETKKARIIADYIAGMTDRYALLEQNRLSEKK